MKKQDIVKWLTLGCFDSRFSQCFEKAVERDVYSVFDNYTDTEIVTKIENYESSKH